MEADLLNTTFLGSESDQDAEAEAISGICLTANSDDRTDRTTQSEAEYEALKKIYVPKTENGEMHATISFPFPSSTSETSPTQKASSSKSKNNAQIFLPKSLAQEILHAVEELYFLRRYDEAGTFVRKMLEQEGRLQDETDGEGGARGTKGLSFDEVTRETLRDYEWRCWAKWARGSGDACSGRDSGRNDK